MISASGRRRVRAHVALLALLGLGGMWHGSPDGVAGPAHESLRLAVVDPPAGLAEALRAGLAAWHVSVRVIATAGADRDPAVGTAQLDDAAARALAVEERVAAIVWLTAGSPPVLSVLELARPNAMQRALDTSPPFDDADAAAVALSVKTLLRNGALDPEVRAGRDPVATTGDASSPEAGTAPAGIPPRFWMTARSDYRYLGAAVLRLGLDLGVDTGWRLGAAAVQVSIGATAGPASAVATDAFVGKFHASGIVAAVQATGARGAFRGGLALGALIERTRLEGALGSGRAAEAIRYDPGVVVELAASWAATERVRLGVAVGAAPMLRPRHYLVDGEEVLASGAILGWVGVRIAVGL